MECSSILITLSLYLSNDLHVLEYFITKSKNPGTVIVSEFAHGFKHLTSLVKVNPYAKKSIIEGF